MPDHLTPPPSDSPHAPEPARHYTHGELTIHWQPAKCIHSKLCWKGLLPVFNPWERPWIKPDAADPQAIMAQIDKCPSGALSYSWTPNAS